MVQSDWGAWMSAVVVPVTLVAIWNDVRRHRVPNWLTGALAVSGLFVAAAGQGTPGLWAAFCGLASGFAALFPLWVFGVMGGGDVKLMAALGAWLGWSLTVQALIAAGLVGGVLALAMIVWRGQLLVAWLRVAGLARNVLCLKGAPVGGPLCGVEAGAGKMPYAVPLSVGTWLVLAYHGFHWWGMP